MPRADGTPRKLTNPGRASRSGTTRSATKVPNAASSAGVRVTSHVRPTAPGRVRLPADALAAKPVWNGPTTAGIAVTLRPTCPSSVLWSQ